MSDKSCMNCGTIGCDHKDAMDCSNGRSLWTPIDKTPFMSYRDECERLRAQVAALTRQNASYKMLTDSLEKRLSYALLNCRELDAARATLDSEREANMRMTVENSELTTALGKAREAITTMLKAERSTNRPPETVMQFERKLDQIRNAVKNAQEALAAIDAVSGGKGGA